ncbi:unnamed protein product [Nyctereutes procyonoides]|uniref:(raccoon dog) hypothetical protein n=1 Tax=Nyctereutes procyonoides TaxID=34880 RepID=A0A811Y5X2_NYCPR|nr:unnamed protein product [Nyctereutes procyonoides]
MHGSGGSGSREVRGDPVSFLILQPRLLEGVSLTLKGLVLSCLPAACPWLSGFAELSTQQRLGRLSCCSWERGAEKSSCPRWLPSRVQAWAASQPCLLPGPSEPRRAFRGPWRSALLRPFPADFSAPRRPLLLQTNTPHDWLRALAGDTSSPPSKKEWLLGKQGTQFWNVRGQAGQRNPSYNSLHHGHAPSPSHGQFWRHSPFSKARGGGGFPEEEVAEAVQLVGGGAWTSPKPTPTPLIHSRMGLEGAGLALPVRVRVRVPVRVRGGWDDGYLSSDPTPSPALVVQPVPLTIQPLQHLLEDGMRWCVVPGRFLRCWPHGPRPSSGTG